MSVSMMYLKSLLSCRCNGVRCVYGVQGICSDVLRGVGQRKLEARMAARR